MEISLEEKLAIVDQYYQTWNSMWLRMAKTLLNSIWQKLMSIINDWHVHTSDIKDYTRIINDNLDVVERIDALLKRKNTWFMRLAK